MQLQPAEYIALPDVHHAQIRCIDLAAAAGLDNIADTDLLPDEEVLPFSYRLPGIVIAQGQVKDFIENRPEHAVATAVAKVDISLLEPGLGKPRRRQGADDDLFGACGNKYFVGV